MSLERKIGAALQARAEGDVDIESVIRGAAVQARRQRRRARVMTGALVVFLVLAAATAPSLWRMAHPGDGPVSGQSGGPRWTGVLRPPLAGDAATASQQPDVVGRDPQLLHFDVDAIWDSSPKFVLWNGYDGVEAITAGFDDSSELEVRLTRFWPDYTVPGLTGREVRVGELPATIWPFGPGQYKLRWQPVPGTWAMLDGAGDETNVLRFARSLRFDRVYRCVASFRLGWAPPGTRVTGCSMYFSRDAAPSGSVNVRWDSAGAHLSDSWKRWGTAEPSRRQVNGREVQIWTATMGITEARSQVGDRSLVAAFSEPAAEEQAAQIAGYWEPVGGPDPATWTANPLP